MDGELFGTVDAPEGTELTGTYNGRRFWFEAGQDVYITRGTRRIVEAETTAFSDMPSGVGGVISDAWSTATGLFR